MRKLSIICVLLALIIGIGWVIQLYHQAQPKTDDIGVGYLLDEGNKFLNVGRYDEAKRPFLTALQQDPKNLEAAWGLKKVEAKEIVAIYKFKDAVDVLYQQEPSDAHVNLFMGEFYLATNQLEKAAPYFQQAMVQNTKLAEAHFDLGQLYDQQGDIDAAKSEFSLAIDIAPMPKYRNKLGHAYIEQQHVDAAIAEYEKTTEYPLSALDVAELYWQRDRVDLALIRQLQAVQWLKDRTIMAKPENKDPWFFKINAEKTIQLGKLEEKKAYAYLNLAFTLHLLDNAEESAQYIQEMRDLVVIRQDDVNAVMNANLDVLLQKKDIAANKIEAFKKLYLAP
jgi:tetratricopeptide (TPR) repeat protein